MVKTLTIDINKSVEVIFSAAEHTFQIRLIRIKNGGGREYLATVDLPLSCAQAVLEQGLSLHSVASSLIISRVSDDLIFSVVINAKECRKSPRAPVANLRQMLGLP